MVFPERGWELPVRWVAVEAFAPAVLNVLPGKALAATAVNTPVRAALPAISQRLQRASRRRATSRERMVWGLRGICAVGPWVL